MTARSSAVGLGLYSIPQAARLIGVFEQIARPYFRKLEYSRRQEREAIRYWPLEPAGRVVLDPERDFGQPIDAQTGAPTRALYARRKPCTRSGGP